MLANTRLTREQVAVIEANLASDAFGAATAWSTCSRGDVAWRMRNIERVREKARLATWMSSEDRAEVREELAGLERLHVANPELHMMPAHDAAVLDSFVKDGLPVRGSRRSLVDRHR